MNLPTSRSLGDHFEIRHQKDGQNISHFATSITKATTWMAQLVSIGATVEIAGITPYGRHKVKTCDKLTCKYCESGVGTGGRESKETRRTVTRTIYSNVQTLDTKELQVGDVIFTGLMQIFLDRGRNECDLVKFAGRNQGRVFKVKYLRGSKKGNIIDLLIEDNRKISVTRWEVYDKDESVGQNQMKYVLKVDVHTVTTINLEDWL